MDQPDLLTPAEAGALLGVSHQTMRRWAALKKIRHVRTPSGKIRFRRSDLPGVYELIEPEKAS